MGHGPFCMFDFKIHAKKAKMQNKKITKKGLPYFVITFFVMIMKVNTSWIVNSSIIKSLEDIIMA